jgi:predicted transposase/invertase (TIGR01784 family)
MDTVSQSEYIDYLKNVRISQHAIESVRKESKIEGKIEGKIEVVLALHEDGIPITQIAKYTKLSDEEVEKILSAKGKLLINSCL